MGPMVDREVAWESGGPIPTSVAIGLGALRYTSSLLIVVVPSSVTSRVGPIFSELQPGPHTPGL